MLYAPAFEPPLPSPAAASSIRTQLHTPWPSPISGNPLLADLLAHIPVIAKPGARAIEEAVTQTQLQCRVWPMPRLRVGRTRAHRPAIAAKASKAKDARFIGKVVTRRVPECRALQL